MVQEALKQDYIRIIYPTHVAWVDTVDGQPNDFRQIILDLQQSHNECTILTISDEDYQGFDVRQSTVEKYCIAKGRDYWQTILTVADACYSSTYTGSHLANVFVGLKAEDTLLNELVPVELPESVEEDEQGMSSRRTFANWYQNSGPGVFQHPNEDGKVLLLTNVAGEAANEAFLHHLNSYVVANPTLNIEYLTLDQFKTERDNGTNS